MLFIWQTPPPVIPPTSIAPSLPSIQFPSYVPNWVYFAIMAAYATRATWLPPLRGFVINLLKLQAGAKAEEIKLTAAAAANVAERKEELDDARVEIVRKYEADLRAVELKCMEQIYALRIELQIEKHKVANLETKLQLQRDEIEATRRAIEKEMQKMVNEDYQHHRKKPE